jgi:hypothetical protein
METGNESIAVAENEACQQPADSSGNTGLEVA